MKPLIQIVGYPFGYRFAGWLLFLFALSGATHAGIHSCQLSSGDIVFQDTPCLIEPVKQLTARNIDNSIPFDIHESWFEKPALAPDKAFCDENGCDCSTSKRPFKFGLQQAVVDALYMDANWHRHSSLNEILLSETDRLKRFELRRDVETAACEILMSQQALKQFGPSVLNSLRSKKREAENRGMDNPDDCDGSDSEVCQFIDAIFLYDQMQADIVSLRMNTKTELLEVFLPLAESSGD